MVQLPSNIITLQDEDEYCNLLVYADSGVGKTVFSGSDDEVLFIAPEDNGTISAKRMGSSASKWKIHGWKDISEAYKWLASLDSIPFNWVILDSLTEMQAMCMRHILDEGIEINPSRDLDVPQLQDWQPYYLRFERMVKSFNALPVNMMYTALQMDEENDEGEKVVLPMMQGKGTQYAKKVASWMTSFGHMRVVRRKTGVDEAGKDQFEDVRRIQWKASRSVMAKDRTRCLEPFTTNLSLKEVREMLESGPQPTPQPGRVVPKQPQQKTVKVSSEPFELMSVGADGEDEI